MLILAVDTAIGQESCAIIKDGHVVAFSKGDENSLQAERLFEHMDKVLKEAKLELKDMNYFAADLGPGSFTGIRIGLSAILAICFANNKQLVGVSSLEALAHKMLDKPVERFSAALNAGREQAYYQEFKKENGLIQNYSNEELIEVEKLIMADIGNLKECKINIAPDAADIGIAALHMIKNNIADFSRKSPIYVRAPDAKIKITN